MRKMTKQQRQCRKEKVTTVITIKHLSFTSRKVELTLTLTASLGFTSHLSQNRSFLETFIPANPLASTKKNKT